MLQWHNIFLSNHSMIFILHVHLQSRLEHDWYVWSLNYIIPVEQEMEDYLQRWSSQGQSQYTEHPLPGPPLWHNPSGFWQLPKSPIGEKILYVLVQFQLNLTSPVAILVTETKYSMITAPGAAEKNMISDKTVIRYWQHKERIIAKCKQPKERMITINWQH